MCLCWNDLLSWKWSSDLCTSIHPFVCAALWYKDIPFVRILLCGSRVKETTGCSSISQISECCPDIVCESWMHSVRRVQYPYSLWALASSHKRLKLVLLKALLNLFIRVSCKCPNGFWFAPGDAQNFVALSLHPVLGTLETIVLSAVT